MISLQNIDYVSFIEEYDAWLEFSPHIVIHLEQTRLILLAVFEHNEQGFSLVIS